MNHVKCYIPEYPRPQLVRSNWENLNGEWDFAFGEDVKEEDGRIGILNRYGAVRGVGGINSWGCDVEEDYRIQAEKDISYSFTIS